VKTAREARSLSVVEGAPLRFILPAPQGEINAKAPRRKDVFLHNPPQTRRPRTASPFETQKTPRHQPFNILLCAFASLLPYPSSASLHLCAFALIPLFCVFAFNSSHAAGDFNAETPRRQDAEMSFFTTLRRPDGLAALHRSKRKLLRAISPVTFSSAPLRLCVNSPPLRLCVTPPLPLLCVPAPLRLCDSFFPRRRGNQRRDAKAPRRRDVFLHNLPQTRRPRTQHFTVRSANYSAPSAL
jgi:hypothetical protein